MNHVWGDDPPPEGEEPEEGQERGLTEQELLKRIEQLESADEQRDEFGRYVAKHAMQPRKRRWWQRRKRGK